MRPTILALLLTAGCGNSGQIALEISDLELQLDRPTYGMFAGDAPVMVSGKVSRPGALVEIEGETLTTDAEGRFTLQVPLDGPYRNIDVKATYFGATAEARVPVFRGRHPAETFPGGMSLRVGPEGLAALGEQGGALIDGMGLAEQLLAGIPVIDLGTLSLTPTALTHAPTVLLLMPAEDGLDAIISLRELRLQMDLVVPELGITEPVTLGWEEVQIGARVYPQVDEAGLVTLELGEPVMDWIEPSLAAGALPPEIGGLLLESVSWLVEPLLEGGIAMLFDAVGVLPLGGPYAFEQDLMGSALRVALTDLYGDPYGLGGDLSAGLGELLAVPDPDLPVITDLPAGADLAIALHEGVLHQAIAQMGVLDLLSQEITLSGTTGELLGMGITALPGGDQVVPGDGWCLTMEPGTAWVTRMQPGIDPFAAIYLPDFRLKVAPLYGRGCGEWLSASLAVEADLLVRDGSRLRFDLAVHEGVLLSYGAEPGTYDEAEVIAGLGTWLESMMGMLAGSALQLDLGDMLGNSFGNTSLVVVDSAAMGPEGLFAVSLGLWE